MSNFFSHTLSCACVARVLLERLLPALLNAVATSASDADLRFSCLKVLSDLLALLLDLNADGDSLTSQQSAINNGYLLNDTDCLVAAENLMPETEPRQRL